jgi:hypothetical protein
MLLLESLVAVAQDSADTDLGESSPDLDILLVAPP